MITRRVVYAAGGLSALAALGLVGSVEAGASLWFMLPAVVFQIVAALCFTWRNGE